MAEAILKRLVSALPDAAEWHIESAGTVALPGSLPAPLSQYVMQTQGMDISAHRSQPIAAELLRRFDLVLTMEHYHKAVLQEVFRDQSARIFMLSEMAGLVQDIPDPIGGDLEDYQATTDMLTRMLSDGLDRIIQQARGST